MELETMRPEDRTAFIAIVGRPNVGKSSLLNRMLGQKVAIVSSKPQTTRTRIMGVLTEGADQLVFIDTPGLMRPRNRLGDYMVRSVTESVSGVDACLLVVEAGQKISPADLDLIEKFRSLDMPAVLAINKIDLLQDKSILMAQIMNDPKEASKPEKVIQGMIQGRINKEMKEICLLDQVYVKAEDGKQSVSQYVAEVAKANGAKIAVKKFVRFETGEGMEKKNEDFAAEVAKQMGQ